MIHPKVVNTMEIEKVLEAYAKRPDLINFAINDAINKTIPKMHANLQKGMKDTFDRPTAFVTRGIRRRFPSGKAKGGFMPPNQEMAGVYMEFIGPGGMSPEAVIKPHVPGMPNRRRRKRHEKRLEQLPGFGGMWALPARGYPLNKNGNMFGSRVSAALSLLGTVETALPARGSSKPKRRKGVKNAQYYVIRRGKFNLIMERRGKTSRPFIYATRVEPRYQKNVKFDFFGIGTRGATEYFKAQFAAELAAKWKRV